MKGKVLIADSGLIFAAFVWGSTFIIVKDSLQYVDALVMVGYRFLLAAMVLAGYLFISKRNPFKDWKQGCVLGAILWLLYVPQTLGLHYTTASNSGFITGLFIVFVPLFSLLFLRKKPEFQKIIATLISLVGLWFLTGGLKTINIGDLLTLVAAMAYAAHILAADVFVKKNIDPYVLSFQQFFFVGIFSIFTAAAFRLPFAVTAQSAIVAILFLGIIPTALAFVIQLVAQRFTTPTKVALIFALEPVFAAVFAWTLGGEIFHWGSAIGGMLIVIAMVISEIPSRKTIKLASV